MSENERNELLKKVEELKSWEAVAKEAEAEVDKIKESLKEVMEIKNVNELHVGKWVLRYKEVFSKRFQSKEFCKLHQELYDAFCMVVGSKRFTCD